MASLSFFRLCSIPSPAIISPESHRSDSIFRQEHSLRCRKPNFRHKTLRLHSSSSSNGKPENEESISSSSRFLDEDGVVEDMDGYLNYLSLEYDSVWDTKPSWGHKMIGCKNLWVQEAAYLHHDPHTTTIGKWAVNALRYCMEELLRDWRISEWCQPWTITLTGASVVAGSWLILHNILATSLASILIGTWWYIFLYSYPKAYTDMIAERRKKVTSGVEDTFGLRNSP